MPGRKGWAPRSGRAIYQAGLEGVKLNIDAESAHPRGRSTSSRRAVSETCVKRLARTEFLLGASRRTHFPVDSGAEVAFAGRSNAGKSSAINALTGRRALARVSRTPGRTRQVNFYAVEPYRRLVDLPGYGYAKVSQAEKRSWGRLVGHYLHSRESLAGVVLIADARRGLTASDLLLLDAAEDARVSVHLVLTKADKLNRRESRAALLRARADPKAGQTVSVQLFSATRRIGVETLAERVCGWLPD